VTSRLVIRPYRAGEDAAALFALWQASLESTWPISSELLQSVLTEHPDYRNGDHFVALRSGQLIGFVGTQVGRLRGSPTGSGGIALLMVHPERRRQGIGRRLHETALNHLRRAGVRRAQLAGGGSARFWPGVPLNLPDALPFFQACGWDYTETSHDLVQHLGGYRTPPGVFERVAEAGISFRFVRETELTELWAFERREFPEWVGAFSSVSASGSYSGEYEDILVARDTTGAIVASLLIFSRESTWTRESFVWRRLLGDDMGGLACVGTAVAMRDCGIGTALCARATEILQQRGVGYSHVGWTWLLEFYGRLGYQPWREYRMSWQDLLENPGGSRRERP
jgi:beta-N-acetylhexosaminidase